MTTFGHPSRQSIAIIGAGPIGLESAIAGLDAGLDVHVFERGDVGAHPIAWGHVRMFTPWRMNVGPASKTALERTGWTMPPADECPTGLELAERYLEPLANVPLLEKRVHTHERVVHVGRRGAIKRDSNANGARAERMFRLLVRNAGGRESLIHAYAVIDASGVYGQPSWAGDGGIPARGELYLAPQLSYHPDDVLGLRRARYAGKHTMVIGAGASAATVVSDLVKLAAEAPSTNVTWVTRCAADALFPHDRADDPLPARHELFARAKAFAHGNHPAVKHFGGAAVDEIHFNSATHRYRVTLTRGDQVQHEEVDQVVVNTGLGPDDSIYRELQIHESYTTRGPMKLAAALEGAGATDCLATPAFGADALANPEPNFYIVGNKSYGRTNTFLLQTGYSQVADVVARLAADLGARVPA